MANTRRRVLVPRESRTTRASAGLVVGHVRASRGVINLLRFPGDDSVLDVYLPGAGARAVHAVSGTNDAIVAEALTVKGIGLAATDQEHLAGISADLAAAKSAAQGQKFVVNHCGASSSARPRDWPRQCHGWYPSGTFRSMGASRAKQPAREVMKLGSGELGERNSVRHSRRIAERSAREGCALACVLAPAQCRGQDAEDRAAHEEGPCPLRADS